MSTATATGRRSTRVIGRAAKIVLNTAAVLGLLIAAAVAAALLAGVRPIVFVSGSMHPAIDAGALALTKPVEAGAIREGDIVSVVRDDDVRVTHRAVETSESEGRVLLTMRGDANNAVDADRYDVSDGADRVFWHLNGLGTFLTSLRTPWLIAGAAALLLIAVIPGKRSARRRAEKARRRAEAAR
ncbi:signal peptidase I [Leifsonia sp. F6_8S_P_1B]|uniref:Signal peptidase I n=1 Tax=Leifsonia williamsii TaxID=3035919 RepID=A0ABT8K8F9_9MICO|nr:signal peptidase I [Leifsonia williamsii]MDN4613096.1 signal peptidase I [Leifsonia williamsii]